MKPSLHIPGQARRRRAFTLIELIVAVAILTVLILGIGLVFRDTTKAVNVTEATMDIESGVRVAMAIMQDDFRQMTRDSVLVLSSPTATRPGALIFASTGRFASMTGGQERNAAWMVYTTGEDNSVPRQNPGVAQPTLLMRRAFVLTGNQIPLNTVRAVLPGSATGDQFPMTLGKILQYQLNPGGGMDSVWGNYVYPFFNNAYAQLGPLDSTPADMTELQKIWPYAVSHVKRMDLYFCDGREWNNYSIPSGQLGRTAETKWMTPADLAARANYLSLRPAPNSYDPAGTVTFLPNRREYWPTAVKVVLTMEDSLGRTDIEPTYEIILKVP